MGNLTIMDGPSVYWKEQFLNLDQCNAWLSEEKTRPYWKKEFQVVVDDQTAAEKAKVEAQALEVQQKQSAKQALVAAVKTLKEKKSKTQADVVDLLEKLVDLVGI